MKMIFFMFILLLVLISACNRNNQMEVESRSSNKSNQNLKTTKVEEQHAWLPALISQYLEDDSTQPIIPIDSCAKGIGVVESVRIETQEDVNALEGIGVINDYLIFDSSTDLDLTPLASLTTINGGFYLRSQTRIISGFNCLTSLGSFEVERNDYIERIEGFEKLNIIENLIISDNENLEVIPSFDAVTSLECNRGSWCDDDQLVIENNDSLLEVSGFNELTSVGHRFSISNNAALISVSGFNALTDTGDSITISNNNALTSISGFNALVDIPDGDAISISNNSFLESIIGFSEVIASVTIQNNSELTTITGFNAMTPNNRTQNSVTLFISQNPSFDCQNLVQPFFPSRGSDRNLKNCGEAIIDSTYGTNGLQQLSPIKGYNPWGTPELHQIRGASFFIDSSENTVVRYLPKNSGSIIERFSSEGVSDFQLDVYGIRFTVNGSDEILVLGFDDSSRVFVTKYLNDGSIDTSFGDNGTVTTDLFDDDYTRRSASIYIDKNDKIIVESLGKLLRFNTDGSPDITFGLNGIAEVQGKVKLISENGKIYTVSDVNIYCYSQDGQLDSDFGINGFIEVEFSDRNPSTYHFVLDALAVNSNENVIVSKRRVDFGRSTSGGDKHYSTVERYSSTTGERDLTFDLPTQNGKIGKLHVNENGKILLSFYPECGGFCLFYNHPLMIQRFNSDGSPDLSFGVDGRNNSISSSIFGMRYGTQMQVDSEGGIFFMGSPALHTQFNTGDSRFYIFRILP